MYALYIEPCTRAQPCRTVVMTDGGSVPGLLAMRLEGKHSGDSPEGTPSNAGGTIVPTGLPPLLLQVLFPLDHTPNGLPIWPGSLACHRDF